MLCKKLLVAGLLIITKNIAFSQNIIDSGFINNTGMYKNFFFDAGVYASMDAEGFYFAPTVKASVGYRVKTKVYIAVFAHCFISGVNNSTETGKFRLTTTGILPVFHLGKTNTQGMYFGIGLCSQFFKDNYSSSTIFINEKRNYFTLTYALGYLFESGRHKLKFAAELFATGPYAESDNTSSYTEILTQLSLGCKIIF